MADAKVCFLGTRGSVPVCGQAFARYGGATSCVSVEWGGERIILDAGTGLMSLPPSEGRLAILLSHAHADHILGLPMYGPLLSGRAATLYAAPRGGLSARDQLGRLMSPPLWPVGTDALSALETVDIASDGFTVGGAAVRTMEGNHPGGCLVFRLRIGGRSIVYCNDFNHADGFGGRLRDFAADCDLLIYDAQLSPEEYARAGSWGHSTWEEGAAIAGDCRAERLALIHHSPYRTDGELDALDALIKQRFPRSFFAKCGEEMIL